MIDPKLLEFCKTDAQRENIAAIIKHGSAQKAARALGKNRRSVDSSLVRVKGYAAKQGHSPEHDMTHLVPEGYLVKGVSTYYNGDGKPTAQWVKSSIDHSRAQEAFEAAIEMLLHKHKRVHVIHSEGNHDESSSVWLRRITRRTFRDNPRVTVETSPFPFYHYVWGKTFLGWHHGHLQKMEALPLVFSTDPKFKQDFGQCDYAYIKTGHRHQKEVIEKGGVIVEQVETLAARDAYAARGFPYSQRGTIAVTYSKTGGEVSRVTVRPRIEGRKAA